MMCQRPGLAVLVGVAAWCGSAAAWDGGESTDNAETTIASSLQGSWVKVSIEFMGRKDVFPQENLVYTFKGDKYIIKQAMRNIEGTYKFNDTKMPKEIDFINLGGMGNKTAKGIYQLDGDTLKIAFILQDDGLGGPRPTAFKDKDVVILTFQRKN
jgi:uncharacterized protein (TIGR03067 family)